MCDTPWSGCQRDLGLPWGALLDTEVSSLTPLREILFIYFGEHNFIITFYSVGLGEIPFSCSLQCYLMWLHRG